MNHLCAECNICDFMPEQDNVRSLVTDNIGDGKVQPILIVDDAANQGHRNTAAWKLEDWMGEHYELPYSYTTTIRCQYNPLELEFEQGQIAVDRCGVWTNLLADQRALVITTLRGIVQLEPRLLSDVKVGDLFRSAKLGVVLVIPPLMTFDANLIRQFKPKLDRALREAGIVK